MAKTMMTKKMTMTLTMTMTIKRMTMTMKMMVIKMVDSMLLLALVSMQANRFGNAEYISQFMQILIGFANNEDDENNDNHFGNGNDNGNHMEEGNDDDNKYIAKKIQHQLTFLRQ